MDSHAIIEKQRHAAAGRHRSSWSPIGGIVEIAPLFYLENTIEKVEGMRPYSPLELAGRNIYIREGCYVCHSQMIRPFRDEVERYGHYSLAAESMYDHPFQWGSKRTGPDLARVGGRYSDEWHVAAPDRSARGRAGDRSCRAMRSSPTAHARHERHRRRTEGANASVGVPYTDEMIDNANADLAAQADPERRRRRGAAGPLPQGARCGNFDGDPRELTEMDALVAYLQMLGTLVDFTKYDAAGPNLR